VPGCPPVWRGTWTGSLPDGVTRPLRRRPAPRPLRAGEERLHDGGGPVGVRPQGVGTPGDDDEDDRRRGGEQGLDELALNAGETEVLDVAALAGGPAPEEPGKVADDGDADIGPAGRVHGLLDPRCVGLAHWAAQLVDDRRVRELGHEALPQRRHRDPEPELRVLPEHVVGVRVAAEERQRVVGAGTHQRHRGRLAQGEDPIVGEQDHGRLGAAARGLAVARRVEVRRIVCVGIPIGVEQAALRLLEQHAAYRSVDERFRHGAVAHLVGERLAEAADVGQFDVDAGA
jgi:hypothetical protein